MVQATVLLARAMSPTPRPRSLLSSSTLRWTAGSLLFLLAWDASGLDLALARWFGDASGFALRMNPVLFLGLHEGGRLLGWALLRRHPRTNQCGQQYPYQHRDDPDHESRPADAWPRSQ